ncbi:hypothetical protein [Bacillus sp. EB600]|uniref:hypothetical protein n=1 Tax=Bacillus sp. EB600 TaxID=2806345 RepID=UPI002109287B|nr:hypothetical protein [Bacillus sp. EB600]MCQ6280439.1 hypothetical protein [Bacillus sp. EB600]
MDDLANGINHSYLQDGLLLKEMLNEGMRILMSVKTKPVITMSPSEIMVVLVTKYFNIPF